MLVQGRRMERDVLVQSDCENGASFDGITVWGFVDIKPSEVTTGIERIVAIVGIDGTEQYIASDIIVIKKHHR